MRRLRVAPGIVWVLRVRPSTTGYGWEFVAAEYD